MGTSSISRYADVCATACGDVCYILCCFEVLMGDLNTGYYQPSQQLLRLGQMDAFGRRWQIPMTFTDAWAELHPGNPDPSTINNDPVRLDT
jgi:hypothetical protein